MLVRDRFLVSVRDRIIYLIVGRVLGSYRLGVRCKSLIDLFSILYVFNVIRDGVKRWMAIDFVFSRIKKFIAFFRLRGNNFIRFYYLN